MKKLLLFALAAGFIATSNSCKDDDDSPQEQALGTWYLQKWVVEYGDGSTDVDAADSCESNSTYSFNNNGEANFVEYDQDINNNCVIDDEYSSTYSINGNTITLDGEPYEIVTLNNNSFVIVTYEVDFDNDGTTDRELLYLER